MPVLVVTPPAPIVSLSLAKLHLKVTVDDEDTLIQDYCEAAQASLDGPMGWLGRCIGRQTLELRTNTFSGARALPYGPVIGITSVKYVDPLGVEQTLGPAAYQVAGEGLAPAPSASWPQLRGDAEGVRIQYEAGFDPVPPAVRQAILLLVSTWFRNRSAVITGTIVSDMPHGVAALLAPFRKFA